MFKLDLEKAEEPEICWIIEKARELQKTSTSAAWTALKPLTVWITTNCGIFLKRWGYQTTLSASWETCVQYKKQQLELGMEQWAGSELKKEHLKAVYCHPACLHAEDIMRNAGLDDSQAGIKTAGRNISNLKYADDTSLMTETEKELKSLLMRMKKWKRQLKTQHSKREDYGIPVPSLHGK